MSEAVLYRELYRPQLHYTPPSGWINDPNGLFFFDNTYHLFYQYNPYDIVWGNMQWGHATSTDLVHWTNHPVAIKPDGDVFIFSGSAVPDVNNTSGLGTAEDPALVAAYTGYNQLSNIQDQRLAYSPASDGIIWQHYSGNPILDRNMRDFRDPGVFFHVETKQWKMIVALSTEWKLIIYSSDDLVSWMEESEFTYEPLADGIWECPTLFQLLVDGTNTNKRWVIAMSINKDPCLQRMVALVGDFDGKTFTKTEDGFMWLDEGRDFYATQFWNNQPEGRIIQIGWTNCWAYAASTPTSPWRGAMSLPRDLSLRQAADRLKLVQTPVRELQQLRNKTWTYSNTSLSQLENALQQDNVRGRTLEIIGTIKPSQGTQRVGLQILADDVAGIHTDLTYDVTLGEFVIDRSASGVTDFHQAFLDTLFIKSSGVNLQNEQLHLHVFVDHSIVEVYLQQGEHVCTVQVFPPEGSDKIHVTYEGDDASTDFVIYELNSPW